MKTNLALKVAASTMILGLTTIGCTPGARNAGVSTLAAHSPRAEAGAAKAFAKADVALSKRDFAQALVHTEDAVALAPQDLGYRMLLADLYVKAGRFSSAETSFADVMTLNPGNPRASLNLALLQIALGKTDQALALLTRLSETAAPGDVGLAFALAGQPQRAIAMLEPAARVPGADGRVRQNLALSYALAGDWQKARVTAAQDVSPEELNERITQWASFVKPEASWSQVASLLGVTPVEDAGQPVRLALAPAISRDVQLAAVEAPAAAPAPIEVFAPVEVSAPVEAPVQVAVAQPVPAPAPLVEAAVEPSYVAAVRSLVEAPPAVIRASAPVRANPEPSFVARRAPAKARAAKPSRFVVQLGAYRSARQVETAWAGAARKYRFDAASQPLSTTVAIPGRGTFHRLSVSGFGTHSEAARLCGTIRAKGGACFVRANAGDAPVRWASRYARRA